MSQKVLRIVEEEIEKVREIVRRREGMRARGGTENVIIALGTSLKSRITLECGETYDPDPKNPEFSCLWCGREGDNHIGEDLKCPVEEDLLCP